MAYSVLIVDDEDLTLCTISRGLTAEGFEILTAASGEEALQIFEDEKPDLVLLDIVLPGMDGVEVLRQIKAANAACIVVMMSAYHMVDRAVEAMKLGAYDYLIKPFHLTDLTATLKRASEMLSLRVRVRDTVEIAKGQYDFGRVVTQNPAMRTMLEVARKASETDHTTILIQGESGTGKGVLARAIHYSSPRANQPLLELNCATLPDALLESELFGFEPGAFTDARRRKEGLLERAHGGTLFLDEIGNMSPSVQAKLLRVLEEGTFLRLGGTKSIKVDVRLVTATNTILREAVAQGRFREDLFYRLNVVPYGGSRRTDHELSLAGEHPRIEERRRAHDDPGSGRQHRCDLSARGNSRVQEFEPLRSNLQRRRARGRFPGESSRIRRGLHPKGSGCDWEQQNASGQDSRHSSHVITSAAEERTSAELGVVSG